MKLLGKSVVVAAATVAVMALSAFGIARPSSSHAADPARVEGHEGAGHESWNPDSPTPSFTPSNASWGGVFNANGR